MASAALSGSQLDQLHSFRTHYRKLLGAEWLCWYRDAKGLLTSEEQILGKQVRDVTVSTLGTFRVKVDDTWLELNHEASRKVMAMLVFSDDYACPRELIASTIWPDATRSKSLASLRQAVLQIKRSFASVCGDDIPLEADAQSLSLINCGINVDVNHLIESIASGSELDQEVADGVSQTFLQELISTNDHFSDWLSNRVAGCLDQLKLTLRKSLESDDSALPKLQYASLLSKLDPCDELACRTMMERYHHDGEKAKALNSYSELWKHLEVELDVEPSSATQELAVAIKLDEVDVELTLSNAMLSQMNSNESSESSSPGSTNDRSPADSIFEPENNYSIVPRIAVVPFVGRGVSKEQLVIGEVLADDLINVFSKCNTISVISRLSSRVFSGLTGSQQTMQMLNVQYLMTGTYRVVSNRIILDVEFSYINDSSILWEKRFTGDFIDFMSGDHSFVEDALHGMGVSVMANELRKTAAHSLDRLDDYTLLIGGIAQMHRLTMDSFRKSKRIFETLIERNPNHSLPYAYLSMWYVLSVVQGWSDSPTVDGEIAFGFSSTALDIDPFLSLAHTLHGYVNTNLRQDLDLGEKCYTTALEYNPSDSLAWLGRGTLYAFKGMGELAVSDTSKALSISPFDPQRYFYYSLASSAAYCAHDYEAAIELANRSLRLNGEHASSLRVLAMALWSQGNYDDAKNITRKLLKVHPSLTISSWLRDTPCTEQVADNLAAILLETGVPK